MVQLQDCCFALPCPEILASSMAVLGGLLPTIVSPPQPVSLSQTLRHTPASPPPRKCNVTSGVYHRTRVSGLLLLSVSSGMCQGLEHTPRIVSVVIHDDFFRIWLCCASSWSYPVQVIWERKEKLSQASPTHSPMSTPLAASSLEKGV